MEFLILLSIKNRIEFKIKKELRNKIMRKPDSQQKTEKILKQERMAKALRENLLKRKQQQRERTEHNLEQLSEPKKVEESHGRTL